MIHFVNEGIFTNKLSLLMYTYKSRNICTTEYFLLYKNNINDQEQQQATGHNQRLLGKGRIFHFYREHRQ